jgi:VIT1/CCC1 family predicted Fe2+/Mn2+ transporter
VDDDFDYLPGDQRPRAGTRAPGYPYGGPPRTRTTGPQPRLNGTGQQPRIDGTGPLPRIDGTGPQPQVNGTCAQPRVNGTGPQPRLNGQANGMYARVNGNGHAAPRYQAASGQAEGYPPMRGPGIPGYPAASSQADGRPAGNRTPAPGYPTANGRGYLGSPPADTRAYPEHAPADSRGYRDYPSDDRAYPDYPPASGRGYPEYPEADGRGRPGYLEADGRGQRGYSEADGQGYLEAMLGYDQEHSGPQPGYDQDYPGSGLGYEQDYPRPVLGYDQDHSGSLVARRRGEAAAPPAGKRVLGRLVLLPKALPLPGQGLREHRDVSGGWLRPAVFGAMDGLVTNSSLIAGVGGGGGARAAIVLTGIAGLIAGAFSMATGEYISVTSQNELTAAEVELERLQHRYDRAAKLGRLTEIYMDKGVSPNLAEAVARQISADEDRAVATHVREELGIDPDDLPSPRTAAAASFAAFTVGALLPLSPFLLGVPNLKLALVIAGIAALVGGAAVAKLTDRSMLLGGLRQFAAAFLATGMAFAVGHVIGGHIS